MRGLLLATAAEETDGFELAAHFGLFAGCDVDEGSAVGAEVEADELHDALAAHDVSAEMTDDVDDLLRVIL